MSLPQNPSASFTKEYTTFSTPAVTYSASSMPKWIMILGAGTTVVTNEDGSTGTFVTDATNPNRVLTGTFSSLVSTTSARVVLGTDAPPQLPPAAIGLSVQTGTVTLAAGVSAAIAATVTSSTVFLGFLKASVPGAGNLTIEYSALTANVVVGTPGSFKITALIAAGTINVLDLSTLYWVAIG